MVHLATLHSSLTAEFQAGRFMMTGAEGLLTYLVLLLK
jgi:hypothetical protein